MITIKADIKLTEEDAKFIRELQRQQSAVIRSSHIAHFNETEDKEIVALLKSRFYKTSNYELMDSWFLDSAYRSGKGSALADSKLGVEGRCYGGKNNFANRQRVKFRLKSSN